jgi:hypothetical protein
VGDLDDRCFADPHRIRTDRDLDWLFRNDPPGERHWITCDYCGARQRKNHKLARDWFLEHECAAAADPKQSATLTATGARLVEAYERRVRFWTRTQHNPPDLIPPRENLVQWLVAARRTIEEEEKMQNAMIERIDQAEARLAETLLDIQRTVNQLAGRYELDEFDELDAVDSEEAA